MESEVYSQTFPDEHLGRDTRSLLFNFSHSINILKYYGSLSQCHCLLLGLCTQTRELWERYSQAYAYGLVADGTRRTLICNKSFNSTVTDYFENMPDSLEFHLYDYVLVLKTEECINEFCEFIRRFKHRSLLNFYKIYVHYEKGMTCDLLNSPYDILSELSLDTSCIQINKLQDFVPEDAEDVLRYTHKFSLSTITLAEETDRDKFATHDCVKRVSQFSFDDSKIESLLDSDQYKDIIPVSIRQSCGQICIERYPGRELEDENAIRNASEEIAKIFPKFKETGSGLKIHCKYLLFRNHFNSLLRERVTLVSGLLVRVPCLVLKDCNIFYYDATVKKFQSFHVSKILCKDFIDLYPALKQIKGLTIVTDESVLEIQNIQSINSHNPLKLEALRKNRKKFKSTFGSLYSHINLIYIESKEFEFIYGLETLIHCKPTRCENLHIRLSIGFDEIKKAIIALKRVKTKYFSLSVSDLESTHMILPKLLVFKVTDLLFDVRNWELPKMSHKAKKTLKSAILAANTLRNFTIYMEGNKQLLRRTDENFKEELDRIFEINSSVELINNMPFHETFEYN
ncbi:unnamed protein product [Moneuplotes crassus]|uniref:Uncharacterized protein n=1 Tax=Euplotes crassus TaxID=5936 RepID=A0AAD1U4A3_EUPCR|nr:unnamed protein product [Moneuplotes crassus]